MNTLIQNPTKSFFTNHEKTTNKTIESNSTSNFWEKAEFSRFAITPMILVIVACVGGVAAAVAVEVSIVQLTIVAMAIALVEAFILAVLPMRTIIFATIASIIVSLMVIFLN